MAAAAVDRREARDDQATQPQAIARTAVHHEHDVDETLSALEATLSDMQREGLF